MDFFARVAFDIILIAPFIVFLFQALSRWAGAGFNSLQSETIFAKLTVLAFMVSGCAATVTLVLLSVLDLSHIRLLSEAWFQVDHYSFHWSFIADKLSLLFCMLIAALVSLIGTFSQRYLHQDPGFFRFYLLLTLFGFSALILATAGTLEVVFFGWELIGLASALLISFFNERPQPLYCGLRTYVTYRLCDVGLLLAVVLSHFGHGTGSFVAGEGEWFLTLPVPHAEYQLLAITLLLLWASIGKSGLYPLGDWLPRAMEGPTPSSAIFYGAISVHLGVFLLLRISPLFEASLLCSTLLIIVGFVTALHATFVGRAQTDVKTVLAYASMTQIGIIVMEIGLGFPTLAVVHMVGHAFLRTLQILRSPNILHDRHQLEQAMGEVLPRTGSHLEKMVPAKLQPWLYRAALERGHIDTILVDYVAGGFLRITRFFDHLEKRWANFLTGSKSSEEVS
ncbi:MAG: hypothetical protein KDD70_10105 [Bdellovibrionales bacterium]|nr:hypothetical protein [Bdellovibrionales bacterium]